MPNGPSSASKLVQPQNDAEQKVLDCASMDEIADFTQETSKPEVRASFLRAILLLVPVSGAGLAPIVRSTGLRIKGALITEALNLRDCTAPGGGPLPPLVLEDCDIPEPLDVAFAHLARLSIARSRFHEVSAKGVRLIGSFSFSDAKPIGGDKIGEAYIDAGGAKIGGDVDGARAILRAPSKPTDPDLTQYALRLAVCDIAGRVTLSNGEFDGGVSIADSDIRGTVWLSGAKTTGKHGEALLARGARLKSALAMNHIGKRNFVAKGEVSLMGAHIAGRFECLKAQFNAPQPAVGKTPDSVVAVRADNVRIGGHAHMSRMQTKGLFRLNGANIEGNLDLADATLDGGGHWTALNGTNIDIRGELSLRGTVSRGRLALWNGKIGHGLHGDGAKLTGKKGVAIDAANLQIVGDLNLRYRDKVPMEVAGRLNFARCEISRNVNLDGLILSALGKTDPRTADAAPAAIDPVPTQVPATEDRTADASKTPKAKPQSPGELILSHTQIGAQLVAHDFIATGPIKIDLRGTRAAMLSDRWMEGWGGRAAIARNDVTMILDGFSYGAVEGPEKGGIRGWVDLHLSWLALEAKSTGAFSPHAYRQFAHVLREQGHDDEARRVAEREHWRAPARAWYRYSLKPLYGALFGFGLSPTRALITLCTMVAIGTVATARARQEGQLVVTTTPAAFKLAVPFKPPWAPLPVQITSIGVPETPCTNQIEPLFYAVDLMVPVVPLHQESRCDVSDGQEHTIWRWLKFGYSLAGKLVTTLAFITFSGVVRSREQD